MSKGTENDCLWQQHMQDIAHNLAFGALEMRYAFFSPEYFPDMHLHVF